MSKSKYNIEGPYFTAYAWVLRSGGAQLRCDSRASSCDMKPAVSGATWVTRGEPNASTSLVLRNITIVSQYSTSSYSI